VSKRPILGRLSKGNRVNIPEPEHADVRQNGEKTVREKHLIYVGNLAGANYFITAC